MAKPFEFRLQENRLATRSHGGDTDPSMLDGREPQKPIAYDYYCARCHCMSCFDRNLVCQTCQWHVGS
ncbi:hypothetical protein [Aquisphaera insulae]|uniref:hypothetical protein n=1 Tax=Aquisphaera insulae TaxID=2712864 RepID=UPI0013EB9346|nr:hypothetical protein [Aquisphaera insulae]